MDYEKLAEDIFDMSYDELNEFVEKAQGMVKDRRQTIGAMKKYQFSVGNKVSFTSGRGMGGRRLYGTVEKINRKLIVVGTDEGRWRINPVNLRKEK